MSLLGPTGLAQVANTCHHNTNLLVDALTTIQGVSLIHSSPYFHEALIQIPCSVKAALGALAQKGIMGGLEIEPYFPNLPNTLLICATEKRYLQDIQYYHDTLRTHIQQESH
jgi:glycine dehydrogenase subunit 1